MTVNSEATLPTTSGWACTSKAREGQPLARTFLISIAHPLFKQQRATDSYCRWLFHVKGNPFYSNVTFTLISFPQ